MDLNDDGKLDILSGSYSRHERSMAGLFQVLYGKGDGKFEAAKPLNGSDDKPLIITPAPRPKRKKNDGISLSKDGAKEKKTEEEEEEEDGIVDKICTRPFAIDWDGDGKLDNVTGNFAGTFVWFKGEGKGKFSPKSTAINTPDGKPLKITGVHSDPFIIDWDKDGDLDLVSGSSDGGVYLAENTAGKGKLPELKSFRTLIKGEAQENTKGEIDTSLLREPDVRGPTYGVRVWIDDVNGDGKFDLLVAIKSPCERPPKDCQMTSARRSMPNGKKPCSQSVSA